MNKKYIFKIIIIITVIFSIVAVGYYWWREGRWRYIVVHHSASSVGNLKFIKKVHYDLHGWEYAAYHFVINNGSKGTSMGQIEVGDRWKKRLWNTSTQNGYINTFSIAIVLVGNYERRRVPKKQYEVLLNLVAKLAEKYEIPLNRIMGHREVNGTKCPGKYIDLDILRENVRKRLNEKLKERD